jgi:hypothetical protein
LAALPALAQSEDLVVNAFNDAAEAGQWTRWWGSAPQTYEYDSSVDAEGQSNSGALKITIGYDLAQYGGDNQFAAQGQIGETVDATHYASLSMDVRFDPGSPTRPTLGDFGYLEYGLIPSDYSQVWLGGVAVASTNSGWTHIVAPIDPGTAKIDQTVGVVLKMWAGDTGNNQLTGNTVLWVDNVKLVAATNALPPPTMAIQPVVPGLRLTASDPAQQYQRQNVRTLASDAAGMATYYSWVTAGAPVTYSVTVKSFPDAAHSGFQLQVLLVSESAMPYGPNDNAVDWNATNAVFVQIANNADGTATGRFMYKTNQPSGNSMFWNTDSTNGAVGTLAMISDPSPLGTWSVTFNNNTDITLTTPSGSSTNCSMPSAAAALFADQDYALDAYIGIQPNTTDNIGQSAILSRIQISGAPTPLDDTFSGASLDTDLWQIVAQDPTGILQVPPNSVYYLSWAAPATGFSLQVAPTLGKGSWMDSGLTNIFQVGTHKVVLIPSSGLPSANTGYFRLIKTP